MAFGNLKYDTLTTSDAKKSSTEKSVDTSYLFNGSCKAWGSFTSEGTFTENDTFNTSSITDSSTGSARPNWANLFANANYATTMSCEDSSDYHGMMQQVSNPSTSLVNILSASATNTARDVEFGFYISMGDLA